MGRIFLLSLAITGGVALSPAVASSLEGRDIARGKQLYATHCASCHGADLEGQPDWREAGPDGVLPAPPHDATGHTWHHETALLFDYVKQGGAVALAARGVADFPSGMPGFGGTLSDAEILDILGFIRSTWPERMQAVQAARDGQ
ncbi:cytochrome C [Thioclava sp. JM3]|uniref:c-type cytochrome n=1 Tax=unclassified Thioclava TaxID=2621713 RepID=UPI000B54086C|nr:MULTISPECIES: c-type cytochrome [unclassified Thioclava]OWY07950.1 cytochrome C [Thioclava sp. F42-5]OWY18743.1 cytochrome C [Thioclava sp. JM3]PWE50737.1 cytochrome C [Thioclava sp. NG1]